MIAAVQKETVVLYRCGFRIVNKGSILCSIPIASKTVLWENDGVCDVNGFWSII